LQVQLRCRAHEILHRPLGRLVDILHEVADLEGEAVGNGDAQIVVRAVLLESVSSRRARCGPRGVLTEYEF